MKQSKEAGLPEDTGIAAAAPAQPDSAGVLASDQFAGMAGSFEFDPVSGTRRPVAGPAAGQPQEKQNG